MKRTRRPRPPVRMPAGFAGFRFPPEVILLAVRWYLWYGLSYRDLEELLEWRRPNAGRTKLGCAVGFEACGSLRGSSASAFLDDSALIEDPGSSSADRPVDSGVVPSQAMLTWDRPVRSGGRSAPSRRYQRHQVRRLQLVVATAQVLNEGVPSDHEARRSMGLNPRVGRVWPSGGRGRTRLGCSNVRVAVAQDPDLSRAAGSRSVIKRLSGVPAPGPAHADGGKKLVDVSDGELVHGLPGRPSRRTTPTSGGPPTGRPRSSGFRAPRRVTRSPATDRPS